MGVMACDRNGCNKIMCDTCIDGTYYICTDCQEEFKSYLLTNNIEPRYEGEILIALKAFMQTEKNTYKKGREINVDGFFQENTRN